MNYPTPSFESKFCTTEQLAARVALLPRPLVFTNGCFDVLHRGHVTYLAQARTLGATLILGVNSEASVKRQGKGDDRPINSEQDRMAVLAALESVSLVIKFDEDTPFNLILACKPDVLVKGRRLEARKHRRQQGSCRLGRSVHSIPFLHERSTTALLKKIRSPMNTHRNHPAPTIQNAGDRLRRWRSLQFAVRVPARIRPLPKCVGTVRDRKYCKSASVT